MLYIDLHTFLQMNRHKAVFRLLLLFFSAFLCQGEEMLSELNRIEVDDLLNNRIIIKYKNVRKSAWPEVTIFKLIKATPRECAAVFSYYPDQIQYSPDLMESRPIRYVTPTDVHVRFKFDMPWPVSNTVTITGNRLSVRAVNRFQVEWYFIKSDSSENNRGSAQFIPFENFTVYRYHSFIKPKSSLARLFKKQMIKNLKKSCLAFESYMMMLKKNKPHLLKKYLTVMENVLRGEFVFDIKTR